MGDGEEKASDRGLVGSLAKWVAVISAAATVGLTAFNSRTASRVSETESLIKQRQLGLDSAKERVARYQFVSGLAQGLFDPDPKKQAVTVNLVRLTLTESEANVFFTGLLTSSDSAVRNAGAIGVQSEQLQQTLQLVPQINAPDEVTRRATVQQLYDRHAADPVAVRAVLQLLAPERAGAITGDGRINALYFLIRTAPGAWTPDLLAQARAAIQAMRGPVGRGPAVGRNTRAQLDALERHLADVERQMAGQ